jgi:hypothetical protein
MWPSRVPSAIGSHLRRWRRPIIVPLIMLAVAVGGVGLVMASTLSLASKSLTVYRTCTLTATPSTSTVDVDSFVNQAAANGTNGTATTMDSQSSNGANRRIYIRYDLTKCRPAIPATASVKSAVLRLYVSVIPAVCRTEDVFRVTSSWIETTITWNNQPFGTSVNNPPTAQRTSAITIGGAPCQNTAAGTYVNGWDVTADAAAFVAGTATNNGWMVRDDTENSATARLARFSTREANVLAQSPQLIITYGT